MGPGGAVLRGLLISWDLAFTFLFSSTENSTEDGSVRVLAVRAEIEPRSDGNPSLAWMIG